MFSSILSQTTFDPTTFETTTTTTDAGLGLGVFFFVFILWIAVYVLFALSINKLLTKANHPNPWAGWVPIYNTWTLCEIAGRPGWWALVGLLSVIPFINFIAWIAVLVVQIFVSIDLSKSFGKDSVFAILLILLPVVGLPLLGFGDAQYQGAAGPEGDKFKSSGMNNTPPQNPEGPQGPQAPTPPPDSNSGPTV